MEDKLLVTVAPCIPPYLAVGVPALDLSPEGIAAEVIRAYDAGANIAHLHVWDEGGAPTVDLSAFRRTIQIIHDRCDIIIEGSTGGYNALTAAERCVSLETDIEIASLNPGSVNYEDGVYVNSPADISYWSEEMQRRNIKPDFAIFEVGMITNSINLINQACFKAPFLYSFVLGQKGAMPASPKNLMFLEDAIPDRSLWSFIGHGGTDLRMSTLAISMGGQARAGFEDNPYYRPGEPAKSNAQLIERLVRMASEIGRKPATPAGAREMLGLGPRINATSAGAR